MNFKIPHEDRPMPNWRGHKLSWCESDRTYTIGIACESCPKDREEFKALKPSPKDYMTQAERAAVDKFYSLKYLLGRCLENGRGLDLEWCYRNGHFCDNDWKALGLTFPRYPSPVGFPIIGPI